MTDKGKIVRINGSLVIAENVPNAKIGDIVNLGEYNLIGEIVRIFGDRSAIQCYEDTGGLRPGDDVINTEKPLVAELAPGIIGEIFDGLEFSETKLWDMSGPFVKRGVKIPPLDRNKKWDFTPTVKKGDKVEPLDILGEVPETSAIMHRILVPHGIHGTVKEIYEGKFTITDTIAIIEDPEEIEHSIQMLQTWPVRKPRPVRARLPLVQPLFTGQRVIDTFFPIAKGGTGAIPGGFGTGKCVLPDTPVLLENGETITIEQLFKRVKGSDPDLTENEETIPVKDKISVYTFDGYQIRPAEISHVYRGFANKIFEIKTASGRIIKITAPHKLIVFDPEGYFKEVEAAKLKVGEYIAVPRKIQIKSQYQSLDKYVTEIKDLRSRDDQFNRKIIQLLRNVVEKYNGYANTAKLLGIKKATLVDYSVGRNKMPLYIIKRIYELANKRLELPRFIGVSRSTKKIRLPEYLDEKLAELLGLLFSDGMITSREVRFFNNNECILMHFAELFKDIFGIMPTKVNFRTVNGMKVDSSAIVKILQKLGMPRRKKSKIVKVPSLIQKSPESVIAAFIKGYFLGDGAFSKGVIEFSSASKELIHELSYLLTKLGILYSISKHKHGYRLIISSIKELKKFINQTNLNDNSITAIPKVNKVVNYAKEKRVGRVTRDLIPLSSNILRNLLKIISKREFEAQGIAIGNYVYSNENLSVNMLNNILQVVPQETTLIERLSTLLYALDYVALDKIESITVKEGRYVVYDITVPETHNFVGGDIPSILHNTVTLHQLAKWSDADIIVYIGCGERGNEMADVITHFPSLKDPRTGKRLDERSVFIANVSNLPVFAREASIYMGVTIAEYYRDQGYHVALMADSTSRWAEALRDISGRLEEIPVERGFPAYLAERIAEFYERAGMAITLGSKGRKASLTIMGAVSPPGGDFSEPVTSTTIRFVGTLWALDKELAFQRHFPAINWLMSFSKYIDVLSIFWSKHHPRWIQMRARAMALLEEASKIEETARVIGEKSLPDDQRLVLLISEILREGFLFQNAFHEVDTYCEPEKQVAMLDAIIKFYDMTKPLINEGVPVEKIRELKTIVNLKRMRERKGTEWIKNVLKTAEEEIKKLAELYEIRTIG